MQQHNLPVDFGAKTSKMLWQTPPDPGALCILLQGPVDTQSVLFHLCTTPFPVHYGCLNPQVRTM